MKILKRFGIFSVGIFLGSNLLAGELSDGNCSALLTAALGEVNGHFKDLPEPVKFDYSATIEHIREIRTDIMPSSMNEHYISEMQKEKDTITETIKAIQEDELTFGDLKATEDITFLAHGSRDFLSNGRLSILRQERKRLEDLRNDIDTRLKYYISTATERAKEPENLKLSQAVHSALTRNIDHAIKEDLSKLAYKLAEQDIIPKGQLLNCSRHNWRIYEDLVPPHHSTEIKLDQLIDRNPPPHSNNLIALSLCHSRSNADSDFVLLAFHGIWNPATFQLDIDKVSYQSLRSVFPAEK